MVTEQARSAAALHDALRGPQPLPSGGVLAQAACKRAFDLPSMLPLKVSSTRPIWLYVAITGVAVFFFLQAYA